MAHALNYPHVAHDIIADTAAAEARPGLFARILHRMQEAQMSRARRELRLYAPHLESQLVSGEFRKVGLQDDAKLPFVR
jgi:hypothetical protein